MFAAAKRETRSDQEREAEAFGPGTLADTPPQASYAKCGFACHGIAEAKDYVFTATRSGDGAAAIELFWVTTNAASSLACRASAWLA
jgi:hypothetical protein